jgi:NADH-quinone oxidoreductase subunit H
MVGGDWLDIRGWVADLCFWVSDKSVGMSRFWRYKWDVANIMTEFVMCVVVFGIIMLSMFMILWMERKIWARIMDRRGAITSLRSLWVGEQGVTAGEWWKGLPFGMGIPVGWVVNGLNAVAGNRSEIESVDRVNNRSWHGVWWMLPGFIQNIADGMKFLPKEHMPPAKSDRLVYEIAPFIIISSTVLILGLIPLGPHIYGPNPTLSLIFIFAIFSLAPLGVFFAGWSSNNKFTLIGGIRSAAQLTAYEIPLLITVLAIAVLAGSFNIIDIINFQMDTNVWFVFLLPLGFLLYFITMVAEVERIPFDMPEAEAELVEGWWTEYGGMRWGLLFAAEYMRVYAACLLGAHFFLGGWQPPFGNTLTFLEVIPGVVWLLLKAWSLFIIFIMLRAALPRVRTDQILEFGWRWLLPLSMVNLAIAVWLRLWVWDGGDWPFLVPFLMTAVAVVLFAVLSMDEDTEQLEERRRPYSVKSVEPAAPGVGKGSTRR